MNQNLKNWGMLLLLAVVWGSSFILMKRAMIDKPSGDAIFDNNQVAAMRMLIAAAVMLPFGIRHFGLIKSRKNFLHLLIVAFLGNFFPAFLFTYAETGISSGYAGMLNSCTPVFTIVIGVLIFKQALIKLQVIGVLIGTGGIIWLVNSVSIVDTSGTFLHVLAVVIATLCYASSVNVIRYGLAHMKPLKITAIAFSFSFIPALILFFYFDTPTTFLTNTYAPQAIWYVIVLAVFGTALSVIVFNQLIAKSSALFASSVTYFIPIVAVIIGFWDGETLSIWQVAAMLVVLSGVYVANVLGKRRKNKIKEH